MTLEKEKIIEKLGEGIWHEYRIPGMAVTKKGTILLVYEARGAHRDDWADMWITLRRSTDGGETFSEPFYPHEKTRGTEERSITWNNPVLIVDGDRIHLIFHRDYEQVWHCCSDDDGISFSRPVEITETYRSFPYKWNVSASGPGHGISTSTGKLVVPIWLADGELRLDQEASGRIKAHSPSRAGCIYSEDHGKTWKAGFLTETIDCANETAVAELGSGRLLFNFRHREEAPCRILGLTPQTPVTLEKTWPEASLPDPKCFASMDADQGKLYFINCADREKRINLTVYESDDDSASWKKLLKVDDAGGYADIAVRGDMIYVFYERDTDLDVRDMGGTVRELVFRRYRKPIRENAIETEHNKEVKQED